MDKYFIDLLTQLKNGYHLKEKLRQIELRKGVK